MTSDQGELRLLNPVAKLGYDYIELSLAHLAALPESDFKVLLSRIKIPEFAVNAATTFFPLK